MAFAMSDNTTYVTRSMLVNALRTLGLGPGETVMLHVSVKAIGWVVGGPDIVIQALLDVLTPDGTLMMYVSWEDSPYELAQSSPEEQRAYLEECPPFDPARSRANTEWSILTEYLRTWPGACRSDHPDASFAAVGRRAEWITADHPLQYGYGPGSPMARLVETGGRILILGSPLEKLTLLHYAEHMARVPDKPVYRYRMPVLREGERVWVDIEEFDTERLIGGGSGVGSGKDYFERIPRDFLASGRGIEGRVGAARSYLFDAAQFNAFAIEWLERASGHERKDP